MPKALPITDQMIRRWMAYTKSEYNKDQTYAEAKAEIEAQKAKAACSMKTADLVRFFLEIKAAVQCEESRTSVDEFVAGGDDPFGDDD